MAWVLGFTASVARQSFQRPRSYYAIKWNWYDVVTLITFYASFAYWAKLYFHQEEVGTLVKYMSIHFEMVVKNGGVTRKPNRLRKS